MIPFLAVMPAVIAAIMLTMMSVEKVFCRLALPVLVLVPTYYYLNLPALPDLNFFHFAIIPIFTWWLFKLVREHHFSTMDFLLILYVGLSLLSEFVNMGAKDGINLVINRCFQVVMPYLLIKHFFRDPQTRIAILKTFALLGAVVAVLSLMQFKFDISLVDPLAFIWPEKLTWVSQARWGYVRVIATFTHAIMAGLMWAFFAFFALWLQRRKLWGNDLVGWMIVFWNVAGMFMTISRGPMLGFFFGLGIFAIGLSINRSQYFIIGLLLAVLVIPPMALQFKSYVSINRFDAKTETQENAIYRWELLENYIDVIKEEPWLGYGIGNRPVVNNQDSVDNQFLYIGLLHGALVMGLFILMNLYACLRLGLYALQRPIESGDGQLAWLLVGCNATWLVTLATVWMGGQTEQMVFMLLAMAEALTGTSEQDQEQQAVVESLAAPQPAMRML
jgi:hypothetical protein